ncbi:TlpA family protein disulfide reductase [Caenibacillus caldisaponilyticus]|uniref:TlpA family protein disulfide reductase n=1 Tax=Caenibacillus caldisaponilyticus TaxID=1674942 RepID=UPI00117812FB|nr:redoxin domain-containing protein [Caenibacillus caldisaponilyticus]
MNWINIILMVILILLVGELGIFYYFLKYNSNFLKQIQSIRGIQFSTLELGRNAPLFRVFAENGNKVVAKELFKKKNTLLLFISTNCPVCKSFLPHLKKITENYDINFILINHDTLNDDTHIKKALNNELYYIRSSHVSQIYLIHAVPHAILVNTKGKIELSSPLSNINSLFNMLINQEHLIS